MSLYSDGLFLCVLWCVGHCFPGEIIYSCVSDEPKIHLSFDDAVTFPQTETVLDVLKEFEISATFYSLTSLITEKNMNETQRVIQRMKDEGHEIGNHGYNHYNLIYLNETQWKYEIDKSTDILTQLLGHRPLLFRPPYAGINEDINEYVKSLGYTTVLWNVGNVDWYYNDSDVSNQAMSAMVTSIGGIFVMHNDHQGKNNGDGLRNLIKILNDHYNEDNYTAPFKVANFPNHFPFVSFLECIGRDDVNTIPSYYYTQKNTDGGNIRIIIAIVISFAAASVVSFAFGYYIRSKYHLFTYLTQHCRCCRKTVYEEVRPLTHDNSGNY